MDYRRLYIPGGTFFFTLVTYNRRKIFSSPDAVEKLRQAFRYTQERNPFEIIAGVILPDHLHVIWTLPENDSDYSTRWRLIKSFFTRHMTHGGMVSEVPSRVVKGEKDIWQRRFWEHLIRDEKDLSDHIDYIHYNPVKHRVAKSAWDWKFSSFKKFVREGFYTPDWGGNNPLMENRPGME